LLFSRKTGGYSSACFVWRALRIIACFAGYLHLHLHVHEACTQPLTSRKKIRYSRLLPARSRLNLPAPAWSRSSLDGSAIARKFVRANAARELQLVSVRLSPRQSCRGRHARSLPLYRRFNNAFATDLPPAVTNGGNRGAR
jgi:hypothetical protein